MKRFLLVLTLPLFFTFSACQRDQITTYQIPKEAPGNAMPMMPGMEKPQGQGFEWIVPGTWAVQETGGMRTGSFAAKGPNGQRVDISVIPLSGEAGGDLPNINRWRGQINLEPLPEGSLGQNSRTITLGKRRMLFIDFVSKEPLIDSRYKKRVMAAIFKEGQTSWFFKMTGEDEAVTATQPAFLQFLASLKK